MRVALFTASVSGFHTQNSALSLTRGQVPEGGDMSRAQVLRSSISLALYPLDGIPWLSQNRVARHDFGLIIAQHERTFGISPEKR